MAEEENLENQPEQEEDADALAAAWEASMAEGGDGTSEEEVINRALDQSEIDNLFGFDSSDNQSKSGIAAIIDGSLLSYERLPMLEVVFDRFVRIFSTSMRNFTSNNVDIDIQSIKSLRFGEYINSIPMPALVSVFKAVEWDNLGLITIDGSLVYSMVDILLGGRKYSRNIRIDGRPYTTIERNIIKNMIEIMLADLSAAFDPVSPSTFLFERMESNPRFAAISRPADAAVLIKLRVDMEDKGGNIELLFPHVTLEPIRDLLTQVYIGEKFGRDTVWEPYLGFEIASSHFEVEASFKQKTISMQELVNLRIGDVLMLDSRPDDDVIIKFNSIPMLTGKIGKIEDRVAISVDRIINKRLKRVLW